MSEVSGAQAIVPVPDIFPQYHDRYTIARLLGAAPGLIGYDEGGTSFSSSQRTT